MDRIIEVKVGGNYIRKDKKTAGVRGEYEVAILRIEFDESWDEYEKRITFWDAKGLKPTFRALDATRLENHTQSKRVFLVPIPEEPMSEAGEMTFVIDGFVIIYNQDGSVERKKQRSMEDKLEVKYAPVSADAGEPTTPETTIVDQMMSELGRINDSILEAVDAKEDILNMTVSSETLETGESAFVIKAEEEGVAHLHFGLPKGNTGDSGVYIGDTEPTEQVKNVWINPSASELILMIRNEQGGWVEIPAITGKSAYEIAVEYGFPGTEAEWNDAVNLNRIAAENAFSEADKARIAAEKANLTAGNNAVLAREYKREAQEYALAADESATSAHTFAGEATTQAGIATEQALIAQHNAMDSSEKVTAARDFAEQAKANADKAEQYATQLAPAYGYVDIRGGIENWETENITDNNGNVIGSRYGQSVNVNDAAITPNSKVDLQITSEQMVVFYEKSLAFVAENDDGDVTVYCVGSVPTNDYRVQAIVTEVAVNG